MCTLKHSTQIGHAQPSKLTDDSSSWNYLQQAWQFISGICYFTCLITDEAQERWLQLMQTSLHASKLVFYSLFASKSRSKAVKVETSSDNSFCLASQLFAPFINMMASTPKENSVVVAVVKWFLCFNVSLSCLVHVWGVAINWQGCGPSVTCLFRENKNFLRWNFRKFLHH